MSGENCLIFNYMVPGQLLRPHFFRAATKNGEYSIKWRNNIVAVITCDTVMKAV